jgi:hypothetical protein
MRRFGATALWIHVRTGTPRLIADPSSSMLPIGGRI